MRVLYWSPVFWPQIGGVEVIAHEFLPAMQARGYEFMVITSRGSLDVPAEGEYRGIAVHRLPLWAAVAERNIDQIIGVQQGIAAVKRRFRPDVVHLNFFAPSLFFYARTAGVAPSPLLIAFRGAPPAVLGEEQALVRGAVHSATWVTAVAASVLESTRALAPDITARSSVIYNGLPMPGILPAPLNFDRPRLLCLGRLVPEKGFDLALSALARLAGRFPGLELVIAGDGAERDRLERQAADLNLNTSVRFVGWVAPDKVSALINTATIVVMPSRWEGLPGVAIQAAQMARPVVGTRVWGLPEVVLHEETGLVVDMDDATALSDAIARLLDHPEEAIRLGSAARRRAVDVFGWDRYLDAHDSLYRTLVQEVA